MNALGDVWMDPISFFLGTSVKRFESEYGIHGQEWTVGPHLNLLTVMASSPGTGQLRRFIEACKAEYETVSIWHIFNPELGIILRRYGFEPAKVIEPDGEELIGFRWKRPL